MGKIILTIAVPVFNGGVPLIEAIESCKNIDLPAEDFEILIIDNCSTDGMIDEVSLKYSAQLPLRIIHNEINCGRINNWNKCIEYADGEFILFLFANDLIAQSNSVQEAIAMFRTNDHCALVSAPWIYSDFLQVKQFIEPEFFLRTPVIGYYEAYKNISKVIETGKLPFVCLQSCFLRTSTVKSAGILFDPQMPLTTDGVFLSALAIETGVVGFIDRPTMIFRYNAPNRQHSNVKLDEHVEQMLNAFISISRLSERLQIDLTLAFVNFTGLENLIAYLLRNPNSKGLKTAMQMKGAWSKSVKKAQFNSSLLYRRIIMRFFILPYKGIAFLYRNLKRV
ncbi:MAG: glycosyltransferase family 2 protein [Sediminibacterium sp.]|nr:glycosyltransferase family 2 protein [Sediminibacterium sp.]